MEVSPLVGVIGRPQLSAMVAAWANVLRAASEHHRSVAELRRYGRSAITADDDSLPPPKPVHWVGGSRANLRSFLEAVQREVGQALWFAQMGEKHPSAKPLKGFKGAGVLEIVEGFAGDTYRAVYTVRFAKAVYVLHAFMNKSTREIKTPKHEIDRIEARLKAAKLDYERWLRETNDEGEDGK